MKKLLIGNTLIILSLLAFIVAVLLMRSQASDILQEPTMSPTATEIIGASMTLVPTPTPFINKVDEYMYFYGGSDAVYSQIFSNNSCDYVLGERTKAQINQRGIADSQSDMYRWTVGYINAAEEQLKQIGCIP